MPAVNTTVGVFGVYDNLIIAFGSAGADNESSTSSSGSSRDVASTGRSDAGDGRSGAGVYFTVLAQDLATDTAEDVTSEVTWVDSMHLTVPGSLIDRVGLAGRSREDDMSAPGLVIVLR